MTARSWFRRLLVFPLAVAALALTARAEPVEPDLLAARQFGAEFARDYAARGAEAVLNRIDGDAMRRLIFGPELAGTAGAQALWQHDIHNAAEAEAAPLHGYPVLLAGRVLLADDARWLECQFVSKAGTPQLARFRLVKSRIGTVRIADLLLGGDGISFTRRIRQIYLLERVPMGDVSDDEIPLWAAGENYGTLVLNALKTFADGKPDVAFADFKNLPSDVKDTAIWRYYRDAMAFSGCKAARADLDKDIAAGGAVDPFVRFRVAAETSATPAALAALEDLLQQYDEPLLYRCAKANLLLNSGHPQDAYAIASDVIALMPGAGFVYVTAVKAAATAQRPELAVDALKWWALIAPAAEIDQTLRADPSVPPGFVTSPQYLAWFNRSPPAAPLPRP